MSEIKLGTVLKAQSAYGTIKRKLAAAGADVSNIRYITDLAPVLAGALPDDLAQQAQALLADPDALESLMTAFTGSAELGQLVHLLCGPAGSILSMGEGAK